MAGRRRARKSARKSSGGKRCRNKAGKKVNCARQRAGRKAARRSRKSTRRTRSRRGCRC